MNERPPAVRIDDLAEPRFSDDARAILDFMEDAGRSWPSSPPGCSGGHGRDRPRRIRGGDFLPRLELLCRAMREQGGFNDAGVFQQHTLIAGLLKNRLLTEDLIGRHPEILDEQIKAPIIICGLPRTGTTHLHNLISADPAIRSLPYWESLEPVLAERERPAPGAARPSPRADGHGAVVPRRRHAVFQPHARDDGGPHARGDPAPGHRLLDHAVRDHRADAAVARRLPGPGPAAQLRLSPAGPPGAPVAAGRHALGAQVAPAPRAVPRPRRHLPRCHVRGHPPRPRLGDDFDGDDARLLGTSHPRSCGRAGDRALLGRSFGADVGPLRRAAIHPPAAQTIDVHFDEFMADDLAMVAGSTKWRATARPGVEEAMRAFMAEHPRGKFGTIEYDLLSSGWTPSSAARPSRSTRERFGVTAES